MIKCNYRAIQGTMLLVTVLLFAASFYFEYVKGMQPCPLCLMQRLMTLLLSLFCLFGLCYFSTPSRRRKVVLCQMALALAGSFFAARQLWLQSLSVEHSTACMPGLDMLIRYFSWHDVLHALLWGSGDCGTVTWKGLGLTMPAWSAIYFCMMFCASGFLWIKDVKDE